MNVTTIVYLQSSHPFLEVILQGAACGALSASLVLCRARRGRVRVEAWAVTAAWSSLGAGVALAYLIVRALV